jgi:hypothetical protein
VEEECLWLKAQQRETAISRAQSLQQLSVDTEKKGASIFGLKMLFVSVSSSLGEKLLA